ncbi:MAG: SRPBCC family protein [Steroidobacteraceae bacterium]|nr:SRPBCC domain-containing protein [Nevskiaceae bacterium]MCP5472947.1 SRPBCC domain-containing protein [Nevskiaceae bacterium]
MAARKKADELTIVRVYEAPVAAVWDAWTDPQQVAQWWGPRGFTLTTHSKDLRAGGHWAYTMHGPDGTDYPNKTIYHEVSLHRRLVYDHGGHDERPPLFRVTVDFIDLGGQTRMEMTMRCPTPEEAEATRRFIQKAGGHATWDRLAEYLEAAADGRDVFVINRSFDADIETLFSMWVDPRHFARWMGPAGSTLSFLEAKVEPGGSSRYVMTSATGQVMYVQLRYLQIEPAHRLVYAQNFCDREGRLAKPPFAPTWPDVMLITVTFAAEGPAQTRVTVRSEIDGTATEIERRTFREAKPGMTAGWTEAFDKLDASLLA